jgi:3-oxoacyl-[acyl-carrier-protein] synthase-3
MRRLGAPDGSLQTLDVNTTCLSFVSALDLAASLMAAGRHQRVLIVSAETASRGLPWHDDPETAALFGDGAAAVVLAPGKGRIAASAFETHPSAWEACQIASGGTRLDFRAQRDAFEAGVFFRMNGKDLYKVTAAHFPRFVRDLLAQAGWEAGEVDLVVPHQASPLALRHMARALGFAPERVVDITRDHGNMIAASIPLALSMSLEAGRVGPGGRVLLLGTSAGVSFGGIALELGDRA